MTPEQTLDWLAQQHWEQCREERPIQDWIRKMKSDLPAQPAVTEQKELKQWLYALEQERDNYFHGETDGAPEYLYEAIASIKEALMSFQDGAQRPSRSDMTWAGLTDDEIINYADGFLDEANALCVLYFARAIEAKLKEKNQ